MKQFKSDYAIASHQMKILFTLFIYPHDFQSDVFTYTLVHIYAVRGYGGATEQIV